MTHFFLIVTFSNIYAQNLNNTCYETGEVLNTLFIIIIMI